MTEYDYSPDAIERHLAKLDGIAKWVDKTKQHEPVNPFVPLPGEHPHPSDSYPKSPPHSPPQIQQQPYGYPYSYQYQYPYQTAPHYPPQQLYYPTQPQHAFYATPQGIISPTYSSMHTSSSSRHHRSRPSSSRHSSGSRSHHPSPTQLLPMALGPRSYSTPPVQTSPYGTSYMMQQPVMQVAQPMYSVPTGYTTMPASGSTPAGSPYSAYSVPQVAMAPVSRSRSKSHSRSESYSASHSSSHYSGRSKSRSRSYSVVQPAQSQPQVQTSQNLYGTMGAYGSYSTPYLQPTPDQPLVVPINGGVGGYVVVPAKGQGVTVIPQQQQQYYDPRHTSRSYDSDSDSEHGSFFGSLGLGRKDKKSRRRHKRTGSY